MGPTRTGQGIDCCRLPSSFRPGAVSSISSLRPSTVTSNDSFLASRDSTRHAFWAAWHEHEPMDWYDTIILCVLCIWLDGAGVEYSWSHGQCHSVQARSQEFASRPHHCLGSLLLPHHQVLDAGIHGTAVNTGVAFLSFLIPLFFLLHFLGFRFLSFLLNTCMYGWTVASRSLHLSVYTVYTWAVDIRQVERISLSLTKITRASRLVKEGKASRHFYDILVFLFYLLSSHGVGALFSSRFLSPTFFSPQKTLSMF